MTDDLADRIKGSEMILFDGTFGKMMKWQQKSW